MTFSFDVALSLVHFGLGIRNDEYNVLVDPGAGYLNIDGVLVAVPRSEIAQRGAALLLALGVPLDLGWLPDFELHDSPEGEQRSVQG